MKKRNKTFIFAVSAILCVFLAVGCSAQNAPAASQQSSQQPSVAAVTQQPAAAVQSSSAAAQQNAGGQDSDGDGIPDDVEKTYGTNPYLSDTDGDGISDKDDSQSAFADNPIKETSTTALPITIKDARVEDNTTSDHLEVTMTNDGKDILSNFDIYYTITDKVDQLQEAYYQKLTGLQLKPGETKTIHFDNDVSQAGHYFGNMNGLYATSSNGLTFDIILHSAGYAPLNFTVEKAQGTAEVAD